MCACVGACAGGVRFSNSSRIIPRDYRILLLLKMHIPSRFAFPPQFSAALEWGAGLFTCRYSCAASTAVKSS